jgi:hypothetical protein
LRFLALSATLDLHHGVMPEQVLLLVGVLIGRVLGERPQICEGCTGEIEGGDLDPTSESVRLGGRVLCGEDHCYLKSGEKV